MNHDILPVLASLAALGAVVVAMVDGRRAVPIAAVVAALALAPTAATVAGPDGALLLLGTAALTVVAGRAAHAVGRALPWTGGLEPTVPVHSPVEPLFGPRSVRATGAALLLPAASWVSFNIPVGIEAGVSGLLFPAAYLGLCAALRVFLARTVEDVATGVAAFSMALVTTWLLRGSPSAGALIPAAVVPCAGLVTGWLAGRHERRPVEVAA